MNNIVLLDDEQEILEQFSGFVKNMGYTPYTCRNISEVLRVRDEIYARDERITLFILDHELGGETSLKLLRLFDKKNFQDYKNKFIVATGHAKDEITHDYAKFGSMGHLIKPIHENQFRQTVQHTIKRIEYAEAQREDWESAFELLESEGLINSVDELKKNNEEINSQYLALKQIYDDLVEDLKDKNGEDIAKAYESAGNSINRISGGFNLIFDINQNLKLSDRFTEDAKEVYGTNKILFFSLLNYMRRIDDAPLSYRIKYLTSTKGLYEYRTGRDYRLYFTKTDNKIQLERFGHKNIQEKIIETYR